MQMPSSHGIEWAAVVLGAILNLAAIPADSSSRDVYVHVASCKCATTADFTGAAANRAIANAYGPFGGTAGTPILAGTMTMISSTTARSAYVYVTLEIIPARDGQRATIVPTSLTPIDANGKSLAGESESARESVYGAIDINLMAADRSDPNVAIGVTLPGFFSHDDAEISASFFDQSSQASNFPEGTILTLIYGDGSGIVAVYQLFWTGDGSHTRANFSLDWLSATQNGKPINRNGTPLDSHPPGGSADGTVQVNGYAAGSDWTWALAGTPASPSVSITVGDPIATPPVSNWILPAASPGGGG